MALVDRYGLIDGFATSIGAAPLTRDAAAAGDAPTKEGGKKGGEKEAASTFTTGPIAAGATPNGYEAIDDTKFYAPQCRSFSNAEINTNFHPDLHNWGFYERLSRERVKVDGDDAECALIVV